MSVTLTTTQSVTERPLQTVACTVALNPDLKKNLRRIAVIRGTSLSVELNRACRQYILGYIREEKGTK